MPDEPPWTRKVSPLLRPPRSTMLCQTVKKVSGMAAASTIGNPLQRQRVAFMREAIFGVAAADHQRKNAVADFPALDVRSERDDLAGDLEARNIRRAGRRRIEALPLHHVGPVDAGGRDLHQDLARAGRGNGALFRNQHFRPAGSLDSDDGHAGGKCGHGFLGFFG